MSQAIHSRAREVFFEAVELPAEERGPYLDDACVGDDELRADVESLLAHHSPESIFHQAKSAEERVNIEPAAREAGIAGRVGRLFAGRTTRAIWTLAVAVALLVLAFSVHSRIERAMLDIRADELTTVLETEVQALGLWIGELKAQLGFLAEDPRVFRSTQEMIAGDQRVEDKARVWRSSPARDVLTDAAESFKRNSGNAGVEIMNERGEFVFSLQDDLAGLRLHQNMSRELSAALGGETIFVRPHWIEDIVEGEHAGTMYSFVLGPLRDEDGRVFAAIAIVQSGYGPGSISSILEVSQLGETGETYAFDPEGFMLSESRFTDEMRRMGLAPSTIEQGREWGANAQLNVQVRDPGGDLARGHIPGLEVGARPLTRLAALAIAARDKPDPDELRGIVLEPYRNYRGVEVIGAWQWLSDYGFAVATEIEAGEALAPLRYVALIFGVLFVLLAAFVLSTLLSTFSVARLRGRVRELKELGPYHLELPIAEGGMGVVYLAEHSLLKRRTAVKVLSGELSRQSITRFEREVSLASRLTHPNTIEIYDYGRSPEGVFYYAMEYVEGPTLAELVTRFGPPPPARVVHILRQVCASLGEAHREGLVHRDIKPQNIMLCERGGEYDVVKVLDFGLVKDVTKVGSDELSKGIHIGGTPLYMSPERVTSPKRLDARVDIYSLGAVAYYLLAGRPVYRPEGDLDLLDQIVNGAPLPLSEVSMQEVPEEFEDLVMDCLAKDPAERPATVFAVMERLDSLSGVGRWTQEEAIRWWRDAHRESRRA